MFDLNWLEVAVLALAGAVVAGLAILIVRGEDKKGEGGGRRGR
jgi:hypothetical protein